MKITKMFRQLAESWHAIDCDYGLSRHATLALLWNLVFAGLSLWWYHRVFYQNFVVIFFAFFLLLRRQDIQQRGRASIFFTHALLLAVISWFDYDSVGALYRTYGVLELYDRYMVNFEFLLFSAPVADFLRLNLEFMGAFYSVFYDLMMISYVIFYFLPYLGVLLIYQQKQKISAEIFLRYISSFTFLFFICFSFYLIFPVTGPQYYIKDAFHTPLPFNVMGKNIYHLIAMVHNNYIDCFPSAHSGVSFLMAFWIYRLKLSPRIPFFIVSILIVLATVALRYHYIMDVLGAIPLVVASCYCAKIFSREKVPAAIKSN